MNTLDELKRVLPNRVTIYHVRYEATSQYIYFELTSQNKLEGTIVDGGVTPNLRFAFYVDGIYDGDKVLSTDERTVMDILKPYADKSVMDSFYVDNQATNSFYGVWIDHRYQIVGRMLKDFSSYPRQPDDMHRDPY